MALAVQASPPLCTCCTYIPSRNSKTNNADDYQHFLEQLEELINTYSRTHAMVILGDMNASLRQKKGTVGYVCDIKLSIQ